MVNEKELLSAVNEDSVVRLLQKVIQTESTNPPGNELDLAIWLKGYFAQAGIQAEIVQAEGKRANLIARIKGAGRRPALIFSAHLDTVSAGEMPWKFPPFSATLHEGRIYGRGAADMKGGLAALAEAAVILARSGIQLGGDLIISFSYDETFGLRGAKQLVEAGYLQGAGAVLIGEPSTLDVLVAEKGALWLKCRTAGKTAHGSMPLLGKNAIFEMAHFLTRLEENFKFNVEPHPLLGEPTFTVGTIRGGVTINVIPDGCEVTLDIRLLPGMDHRQVTSQVEALGEGKVQVEIIDWKEPVVTDVNDPFVGLCLQAAGEVTGIPRQAKGVSYFTDGTIIANRLHIPMAIIGAADTWMTHQPNENVEVSRLVDSVKINLLVAARYLA